MPIGAIVMWAGSVSDIRMGGSYVMVLNIDKYGDSNTTPDLTDKFILGSDLSGIGGIGGSDDGDNSLVYTDNDGNIGPDGSHQHEGGEHLHGFNDPSHSHSLM